MNCKATFSLAATSGRNRRNAGARQSGSTVAQQAGMTFFVTSVGSGNGADLGGLAGADQHCQQLAQAAGAGGHTWHAYLSTQAANGQPAANARDRIGKGPWTNAKGVVVAKDVGGAARPEQPDQADFAFRERRRDQGPRRHAERA